MFGLGSEFPQHISVITHERFVRGSSHALSENGRTVLAQWTKTLLESGFNISLPVTAQIEVVSDIVIISVAGDDAAIGWTVRIAGYESVADQLTESHFSSEPKVVAPGIVEISMATTDILYGSRTSVIALTQD